MHKFLLATSALLALTACDLSPDLKLPEIFTPAAFKEDTAVETATVEPATDGKWKRFDETAKIEEFAWWRMFNAPALDTLMDQAMKDNPSLEVALQRVKAARAVADDRDADLWPQISAGVGPERQRQSPASQEASMPPGTTPVAKPYTLYNAKGTISYEVDLFGRRRNLSVASWFDAEGEADNYRAARLSLQAELAQTYFRLAALRTEEKILTRTIATREEGLKLTRQKYDVGMVDALVLSREESDLALVKVDAAAVAQSRAMAEHALAVLIGQPPSELKSEEMILTTPPPSVPAGIPSSLLERRPDIKQAEKSIAAANARIGVARTGYFPEISLSAMFGFTSGELSDLFKWSNRTWMIGPLAGTMLTQPIFEGGRIAAAIAESDANYAAAVATYRGAVLQAFREVEDQLSGLRYASEQAKAADTGVAAATRAYDVAKQRYAVGYSSHLEFLDAERTKLTAERSKVQVLGNQYVTTIQLVRALGGSWQKPSVPESTGNMATTTAAPEQTKKD